MDIEKKPDSIGHKRRKKRRPAVGTIQRIFSAEYRGEQNEEKAALKKKGQRKKRQDLRCFFSSLVYKGGEREDLSLVGAMVEREERHILLWSYASNDYI